MDIDLCPILLAEDDLRDGVETLERPRGPAKASAPSRRSAVRLLDAVRRVGVSWALPDEPAPRAQL
jgi:hypothetical protein